MSAARSTIAEPCPDAGNGSIAPSAQAQPAAEELFAALAEAGIAVAVYKNSHKLAEGLAGMGDIDLLVAPDDLPRLQEVLEHAGAVRGYPLATYDNALAGREDWFLPLVDGAILHLDIVPGIRVGPKFRKAYRIDEVTPEQAVETDPRGSGKVPVLQPRDEAMLALVRLAFTQPSRAVVACPREVEHLLSTEMDLAVQSFRIGGRAIACPLQRDDTGLWVDRTTLIDLRKAVLAANGTTSLDALRHRAMHQLRRARHAFARRLAPTSRRRLARGAVIALVGPDGVGKSTQSRALVEHFAGRFDCTTIYLGSNDGSWMRWRQYLPWGGPSENDGAGDGSGASVEARGWLHAHLSAVWRLLVAVNRSNGLRRARRRAARGGIVIADRWPQDLEPGILDGPSMRPAQRYRLARVLWRFEKRIYANMADARPTLAIHLECDFATSHARKPGDIEETAFERRIALMQRMRAGDDGVVVVDARADRATVFRQLVAASWHCIAALNRG